ncbi:molybdopterin-dependent oxidoreductase [Sporomusa sphaeroides DSM 2875]|uniref:molybdopterin-dependent oxidoreductase n=1 Tax=Sporomusa sphaeroides TaxID=47679 RepID=UPI00202E8C25|nr:molybdopterin-dependent oxidoreductase [Sporomusa sphaeroides]MCM0758230.1 molybdopterin-dependent oxidoreductase [Sporomusa sphaeroides DSM 2875]
MTYTQDGYQITRHVCPRNCYDACGMLAYVRNGVLEKVTGDPAHGYTNGKLCAKGQTYIRRVYSPERLRYPMRQLGRGSGRWERLTWNEAMAIICEKILDIKDRYGSTLPLCLNKYSGNMGILHNAVEGMFNSLGPTTQAKGSSCWAAGIDAQLYDLGRNVNSDPEEMAKARLIILWGVNPAWTAIHSLPYIYQAQANGAKVVVIDPIYTQTARKADYFVQISPGKDGALALALAKELCASGKLDQDFIDNYTLGWPEFREYLSALDSDYLADQCGQHREAIKELAAMITSFGPVFVWVGFGLQRHVNGGQSLRAIDALAAMTGNIGTAGSGVQYAQRMTQCFNYKFLNSPAGTRYINMNEFARELGSLNEPPVKLLWVACRNLMTQDVASSMLVKELEKLELIVTVEQFLTPTTHYSDIVLPTTTHFEELDVVSGYWHHWIGLNEQAIPPFFDSKSDLEIARLLAGTLNQYREGSSSFPLDKSPADFLDSEFNENVYTLLGISHWSELGTGPRRAAIARTAWQDKRFATNSGKFEFFSTKALANGLTALPEYRPGAVPDGTYPYWFITSHAQQGLNSQFQNITAWPKASERMVFINSETAAQKGLVNGQQIRVYNSMGAITLKACISQDIPPDVLVCHQGWRPGKDSSLNALNAGLPTDMGDIGTGYKGLAFYDVFVDFEPV